MSLPDHVRKAKERREARKPDTSGSDAAAEGAEQQTAVGAVGDGQPTATETDTMLDPTQTPQADPHARDRASTEHAGEERMTMEQLQEKTRKLQNDLKAMGGRARALAQKKRDEGLDEQANSRLTAMESKVSEIGEQLTSITSEIRKRGAQPDLADQTPADRQEAGTADWLDGDFAEDFPDAHKGIKGLLGKIESIEQRQVEQDEQRKREQAQQEATVREAGFWNETDRVLGHGWEKITDDAHPDRDAFEAFLNADDGVYLEIWERALNDANPARVAHVLKQFRAGSQQEADTLPPGAVVNTTPPPATPSNKGKYSVAQCEAALKQLKQAVVKVGGTETISTNWPPEAIKAHKEWRRRLDEAKQRAA